MLRTRAGAVDELVAQQVLRALEPAALGLSLKAMEDVHKSANASTATGSTGWSGPSMKRNVPNDNIRPSSPRIVSWHGGWNNAGNSRCGINEPHRRIRSFLKEHRRNSATTNDADPRPVQRPADALELSSDGRG